MKLLSFLINGQEKYGVAVNKGIIDLKKRVMTPNY